jgi:hypothetical protein
MFTTSLSDPGTPAKALLHDPPDSAAVACIERTTCAIIAHVFPVPTLGQVFFARFLERAGREPSILPGESKDTVYICTKSIAQLAQELHLSNDTTQKYVVLYMALGLLKKRKFMGQLAFVLWTGIYHPPENLEASLDYLIQKKTSRPKLRAMAVEVKARCRIYGLTQQDLISSLEQLQALLHTEKGTSRRTFEQRMAQAHYITSQVLKVVLTSHLSAESTQGDETRGRKNLPRTRALIDDTQHHQGNQESTRWPDDGRRTEASLFPNLPKGTSREDSPQNQRDEESTKENRSGRFSEANTSSRLPDLAHQVDSSHMSRKGESTEADTSGRFAEKHRSANLPNSPSRVDSIHDEQEGESTRDRSLGRFPQPGASSRLPQTTGEGDSGQSNPRPSLAESTQDGKPGRREDDHLRSNLPDLSRRVDSDSVSRNVNVDNLYSFITTFTLREPQWVAEFLAEQLEGDRRVYPKYQKLFHTQEGQARDPHVLAAAFICTMVRLHRDRWNISSHPGGFFTKRCREYDAGVSEEVEGWIASYGQLSPVALLETLANQRQPGRAPVLATPVSPSSQKPAPKPLLQPLALSPHIQVEPARMVMSKREAQDLVELVLHNRRTQLFRTKRLRLGKQTPRYAVLVDASIPGGPPHQTVVYSRAEWQARLDGMKTWRDLIYPAPSEPPGADTGRPKPGEETRR